MYGLCSYPCIHATCVTLQAKLNGCIYELKDPGRELSENLPAWLLQSTHDKAQVNMVVKMKDIGKKSDKTDMVQFPIFVNNKALAKGDELFYFRKEKSSASSSDYVDKKGEKRKFDSKFAE